MGLSPSETPATEVLRLPPQEQVEADFALRYPLHILVAEETSRPRALRLLSNLGYEALAASNGTECLRALIEGSFDLLLADIDLPEMNGIDCVGAIRKKSSGISVVAVTAGFTRKECLDAGINGFLTKPVILAELKRILKETALRKWVAERNVAILARPRGSRL
jgi:CheY-like chemotaxis protein